MTRSQPSAVRFLTTRLVVGAGAVATLLATWGVVAVTAANGDSDERPGEDQSIVLAPLAEVVPALNSATGQQPAMIVVERQSVVYVTEYVTLPAGASVAPSTSLPAPAIVLSPPPVLTSAPTVSPAPPSAPPKPATTSKKSRGS